MMQLPEIPAAGLDSLLYTKVCPTTTLVRSAVFEQCSFQPNFCEVKLAKIKMKTDYAKDTGDMKCKF